MRKVQKTCGRYMYVRDDQDEVYGVKYQREKFSLVHLPELNALKKTYSELGCPTSCLFRDGSFYVMRSKKKLKKFPGIVRDFDLVDPKTVIVLTNEGELISWRHEINKTKPDSWNVCIREMVVIATNVVEWFPGSVNHIISTNESGSPCYRIVNPSCEKPLHVENIIFRFTNWPQDTLLTDEGIMRLTYGDENECENIHSRSILTDDGEEGIINICVNCINRRRDMIVVLTDRDKLYMSPMDNLHFHLFEPEKRFVALYSDPLMVTDNEGKTFFIDRSNCLDLIGDGITLYPLSYQKTLTKSASNNFERS